jgi:uncharacterized protein
MFERTSYPAGVPCWVDTMQPDPEAAAAFYSELFGWKCENRLPDDAPGQYWIAQLHDLDVAAIGGPVAPDTPSAWNTYTAVTSADATAKKVQAAGGTVLVEPADAMEAGRYATFADPEGATFSVWQPGQTIGAQLVNEPGTWNFSELNTRDREAAAGFYGAVFGWETESFSLGESDFTFFKLPGYGAFLMQSNPELHGNVEAGGAPGGFIDAVALIRPLADDSPPSWSVTFATDDADAVAARAAMLGGTVLVPPFDAEPVRMTVLRDPQGAVFAASRYQPNQ